MEKLGPQIHGKYDLPALNPHYFAVSEFLEYSGSSENLKRRLMPVELDGVLSLSSLIAVDSKKLEYGTCVASSPGFWVEGQSYSNFSASTVSFGCKYHDPVSARYLPQTSLLSNLLSWC